MTYPAHDGVSRISRVHNVALCKEIGERLGPFLALQPVRLSPDLLSLMRRFDDEPRRSQPSGGCESNLLTNFEFHPATRNQSRVEGFPFTAMGRLWKEFR
jgi:hypothetical protein